MKDTNKNSTCCFFGHRNIEMTDELLTRVMETAEQLIKEKNVDTFLFGSKSQFNKLCLNAVSELKKKYPHIRRIYVRAEYPYVEENYREFLLQWYDDTYYPEKMTNAGRAALVERNYEMIENSCFCIIYYDEKYMPARRKNSRRALTDYQPKSGTKIAYDYAVKKKREIINIFAVNEHPVGDPRGLQGGKA